MAKENYVLLIGEMQGAPIINEDKAKAKFVIKTLRRNDKIDYPIINVLDESLVEKIRPFAEGEFILVKGILTTTEVKKGVCCPHCQKVIKSEGTTTEVTAIEAVNIGTGYTLEQLKEVSSTVMLLGSLCRDPEYRLNIQISRLHNISWRLIANSMLNASKGVLTIRGSIALVAKQNKMLSVCKQAVRFLCREAFKHVTSKNTWYASNATKNLKQKILLQKSFLIV